MRGGGVSAHQKLGQLMNECSSWQLGTNVYDLGYGELSGVVQVNTLYTKQIFSEEEYCSLGKNLNNLGCRVSLEMIIF